jgi:hypothetical protein
MRTSLFLMLFFASVGVFFWTILSGALLFLGCLFLLFGLVVSIGYADTMVLYLLGAREVRASDQEMFSEAASQEAYKLSVGTPRLYVYNGTLERAFVLQNGKSVSLVLSKSLLEKCSLYELSAISFELLLQVKKGMAQKRTRCMFLLGFMSWSFHSLLNFLLLPFPVQNFRKACRWSLSYLLHPWLDVLFKLTIGKTYFRKLENLLTSYDVERENLQKLGLKLRRPAHYYQLPSRKLLEFSSLDKSRNFQNIMALEFLPHEWDFLFPRSELTGA